MPTTRAITLAALAMLAAAPTLAQDQTMIFDAPLEACRQAPPPGTAWTLAGARPFIEGQAGAGPEYVLVHVVQYNPERPAVREQAWYVYHPSWPDAPGRWQRLLDPAVGDHFSGARVFGTDRAKLLYVHRGVPTLRGAPAAGLAERAGDREVEDQAGRRLIPLSPGPVWIDESFRPLSLLAYKIEVTAKRAQPVQNLADVLSIAGAQAGPGEAGLKLQDRAVPTDLCGTLHFPIRHQPSDVKLSASVEKGGQAVPLGSRTFDNERRYFWDVSFALPLRSREDLSIDTDAATVTARKVEKTDLFAVFNLSPVPFDTKRAQAQMVPRLLYGIPITGKPLQHHLVAVALGLNRVQAFVGFRFDRRQAITIGQEAGVPTATLGGSPAGNKWDRTVVYGINLPVSTVRQLLGGNGQ